MTRFRSRPSEVEAVQWTGDNLGEVQTFGARVRVSHDDVMLLAGTDGAQGWVPVPVNHWIVRSPDDHSDHWPVDPDYFARKYEDANRPPGTPHPTYAELRQRDEDFRYRTGKDIDSLESLHKHVTKTLDRDREFGASLGSRVQMDVRLAAYLTDVSIRYLRGGL